MAFITDVPMSALPEDRFTRRIFAMKCFDHEAQLEFHDSAMGWKLFSAKIYHPSAEDSAVSQLSNEMTASMELEEEN